MKITLAGEKILNHYGLGKLIDSALAEPYPGSDPAAGVILRLYDRLNELAGQAGLPVEAVWGLVQVYLEETNDKRRA